MNVAPLSHSFHTLIPCRVIFFLTVLSSLLFPAVYGQQDVEIQVMPHTSRGIGGVLQLQRLKYFNICESNPGVEAKFNDPETLEYYFEDLQITFGRNLGGVYPAVVWGNSVREDPSRAGYADLSYLQSQSDPNNGGASQAFIDRMGPNLNIACHDRHNAYPGFMPQYGFPEDTDQEMPVNLDAAGELAANVLKHTFTGFTRPAFYEIVNEPHWKFWSDARFAGLHTSVMEHVRGLGLNTRVGGPCYSVGNFFKNDYGYLDHITDFIDRTGGELDFYSYHIYDYLQWDGGREEFTGAVTSGLPSEGVFDAIANYMQNHHHPPFKFVGSEMGGYINIKDPGKTQILESIANKYFPGSGFLWEMKYREIDNYIKVNSCIRNTMTFMNNPHIVDKSVPFILLETSGWDPKYYAALWIPWEYSDKNHWYETRLIDFYRFFRDVGGRRILSHTNDPDIQQMGFVDGNRLFLLFHNQSAVDANISVRFSDFHGNVTGVTRRLFGRLPDFRPYYYEDKIMEQDRYVLEGRGSMVLIYTCTESIAEETVLNEIPHYGDKVSVQFTGSTGVNIDLPEPDAVQYAVLRVGVSRDSALSREIQISINDSVLAVPEEDVAPLITGTGFYGTTKILQVDTALLQPTNRVEVRFPDGGTGGIGAAVLRAAYASAESVDSIRINPSGLEIRAGESRSLSVQVFPELSRNKRVLWSTGNPEAAIVDSNGMVKGTGAGSAWVYGTAVDGGQVDSILVSVQVSPALRSFGDKDHWKAIYADDEGFTKGMLKELAVDGDPLTYWHTEWIPTHNPLPHEIWVDMGDTLEFDQFIYTPRQDEWGPNAVIGDYELYFSDDTASWGSPDASGSFSWSIGEPDYYKEIQYVSLGTTLTARYMRLVALTEHQDNPDITTSCAAELDVSADATGIDVTDSVLVPVNGTALLEASTLPLGGKLKPADLAWISLDPSIAEVSNGLLTGVNSGTARVVAGTFDGRFSDTCLATVTHIPVTGIVLSTDSLELAVHKFTWLTASVIPEEALYRSVTWRSEDPSVATVRHGFVTALKEGRTRILAGSSVGGFTDTCHILVRPARYDALFTVAEKSTGIPLDSARVIFAGDTVYTGPTGTASFSSFYAGIYSLHITARHFEPYALNNLDLDKNISMEISLVPTLYNVDFRVSESVLDLPVNRASIEADDRSVQTGPDGRASMVFTAGNYRYSVTEPYFETDSGRLEVPSDSSKNIHIRRLLADARFTVFGEEGIRLYDATVEMNGESRLTSALGFTDFRGIRVDTMYGYRVSKDGYTPLAGEMTAMQDTSIDVHLLPVLIQPLGGGSGIRVFPNPAPGHLWIRIEKGLGSRMEISLSDLTGRKMITSLEPVRQENPMFFLDLSGIREGTYLLTLKTGEWTETFRVCIDQDGI
jgi:uncharacterized protein YjdB